MSLPRISEERISEPHRTVPHTATVPALQEKLRRDRPIKEAMVIDPKHRRTDTLRTESHKVFMGGSVDIGHVHVEACKALSELVKRFDRAISGPRGALVQEGCKGNPAPPAPPRPWTLLGSRSTLK